MDSNSSALSVPTTIAHLSRDRMLVLAAETGQHAADPVSARDRPDCEIVLRLPLERPERYLHRPRPAPAAHGEQALLAAVGASRLHAAPEPAPAAPRPPEHALTEALLAGDTDLAYAHAVLLWRHAGLNRTYAAISRCLAGLGDAWAAGTSPVLAAHRATRTAMLVTDRLSALTPTPVRCGTVVLAVPAGEQHTVALTALAHLIMAVGWPVQVVDALPVAELSALAAAPGTTAVVMSVHTLQPAATLREQVRLLRAAAPQVLLVLGGPGLPRGSVATSGADLVTQDVDELLRRLDSTCSALTEREHQVLTAVADGCTNAQIAELLGVAPATVKSHLDHVFVKTHTEHRAAAVARALRRGWIT